ncbi:MAG TPA: hypothetical protein VI566_11785 [Xanthomonadales bacterium]|nr:hypothetical protein [Xanthomonadales bacterium]
MHRSEERREWVDRYLRNELMGDEAAIFETALLDSPDLQLQLETSIGIRQALLLEAEMGETEKAYPPSGPDARNNWQPVALAASVVLAVFSTTMYWKVSNEAGMLQSEIIAMSQPRTTVLTVPVDIMRSASSQTPDVIIHKPEGNALLVLDLELSPAVAAMGQVRMSLRDSQAVELFAWDSGVFDNGRVTAAFDSRMLPNGKVWLEMSDGQGRVIDRRLLEFLP